MKRGKYQWPHHEVDGPFVAFAFFVKDDYGQRAIANPGAVPITLDECVDKITFIPKGEMAEGEPLLAYIAIGLYAGRIGDKHHVRIETRVGDVYWPQAINVVFDFRGRDLWSNVVELRFPAVSGAGWARVVVDEKTKTWVPITIGVES